MEREGERERERERGGGGGGGGWGWGEGIGEREGGREGGRERKRPSMYVSEFQRGSDKLSDYSQVTQLLSGTCLYTPNQSVRRKASTMTSFLMTSLVYPSPW